METKCRQSGNDNYAETIETIMFKQDKSKNWDELFVESFLNISEYKLELDDLEA